MNVLFCDEHMPAIVDNLRAELPGHEVRTCPEDSVIEAVADIDVILPTRGKITAAVMDAVAEMALFLLIGGGRRFPRLRRAIDDGDWQYPHGLSLFGARVCLVGLGGIGGTIARLLRPFGCELVGVKTTPDPDLARELGLAAALLRNPSDLP